MKYWFLAFFLTLQLPLFAQDAAPYDLLGKVNVYHSAGNNCAAVVVSGAEGWKGPVVDVARRLLNEQNCFVVGVDLNSYLGNVAEHARLCPGGDLVRAALHFEKTFGMKVYVPPVLLGYHEGSAMAYLALSESPYAFPGAVSLGFCPDVSHYRKPCKEANLDVKHQKNTGGMTLLPDASLGDPLVVIGKEPVKGCTVDSVADYLKQIPAASLQAGAGDWMPQFQAAVEMMKRKAAPRPSVVTDLPLYEYPSAEKDTLVIILSGDGGWVDLGRDLADTMIAQKYAVVGFDTLQYYWHLRDQETSANDMTRIINAYLAAWKKQKVLLIGYSFGADVLPFMLRRMPEETRKHVAGAALIGPSTKTEFEFNVLELLRNSGPPRGEPLLPELKHMAGTPVLCIGGFNERESLCRHIENTKTVLPDVQIEMLDTGHTFGNDPPALANRILQKFAH